MYKTQTRVLVIDDSAFMRKMITDLLSSNEQIEVVGTARNGEDGLKKIKELSPHVVTLDVEMPVMDGIATLKNIMDTNPIPVIMLSSITKEGSTKTIQAISNGAVDFIQKPSGSISLDIDKIKEELIKKVIAAANVKVSKHPKSTEDVDFKTAVNQTFKNSHAQTIVAIGTSTGGPRALQRVLTDLPDDFTTPIVIVQHMPPGFTKSLADRLNTLTKIHIKEATHGEIIQKSTVYIAPGDFHLKIRKMGTSFAVELSKEAERSGHRPSVDVLFESLAEIPNVNKIAVLLTGMGNDGSKGLQRLKEKDSSTVVVAENEESSIVYGMPKAAIKTNTVNHIVHLHQVGHTISNLIKKPRGM
ncbi:protein-glutamate methylesterase/protein-glutamine glutaminase [Virgibacillus sp. DJP39]|uniref:protein-glutamate methylesterase/protein-glutamine glutaminase n=1 Tax=Virgibacillus sp. DJP39 TaxID=3409790 RepID=UPI003BB72964